VTTRYLAERQALFFAARRPLALDIALGALRRAPPQRPAMLVSSMPLFDLEHLWLDELATRRKKREQSARARN
jgi:hypothetical protein